MNFGNHNQETSSMGPYRPTGESARTTRSTVKRTGETLTEPLGHKPKVKIGSKFQANLPEWPDIYGDENEAIEEECIIPPFSTFSEIHQLDTFSARQKRCLSRIFNNDDDWLGASKGQVKPIRFRRVRAEKPNVVNLFTTLYLQN
uniref:INCENP_ARK-bind domain-containing protein n=1 Tax=Caenorhabditis tropicalis TaxID=1561998 RepID=A0A1I7U211_9PELO